MKGNFYPVERDSHGRMVQRIECACCGAHDQNTITTNGRAGDQTLAAYFRRRGWDVDPRKGHTCPDCIRTATDRRRKQEADKSMSKDNVTSFNPPSPNSALAKKIASDRLFEHYDISARDYKPGWSDARIARESKISEALVAARRAADYGPVKPPPPEPLVEIANLARPLTIELGDVASTAKALSEKIETLAARISKIGTVAANGGKTT